jgi:hypothetical protein
VRRLGQYRSRTPGSGTHWWSHGKDKK